MSALPSMTAARAAWLADARRRNLSPRTIADYDALSARLARTLDPSGQAGLDALSLDGVRAWLDARAGLRPASRRTYIRTLRAWSAWCTDEYGLPADPLRRLQAPRVPRARPGLFTPQQLRTLLAVATPATAWTVLSPRQRGTRRSELRLHSCPSRPTA